MVGLGVMKGRASTPVPLGEGDWDGQQSKTSKAHSAGENEEQNLRSHNTPTNLSGSCAYGNCRVSS